MAGLVDAFKQYVGDAVGGSLNSELSKSKISEAMTKGAKWANDGIRERFAMNEIGQDYAMRDLDAMAGGDLKAARANNNKNIVEKLISVGLDMNPAAVGKVVFHGSPHKFDKFDMSKIGTGEGAQAYGHGLYMADSPKVAEEYKKQLATQFDAAGLKFDGKANSHAGTTGNAELDDVLLANLGNTNAARKDLLDGIKYVREGNPEGVKSMQQSLADLRKVRSQVNVKNDGALYKVDIPDEAVAKMLDWDKPLSQQHPDVVGGFRKFLNNTQTRPDDAWEMLKGSTGGEAYFKAGGRNADSTSMQLNGYGIPGIRYLDGGSRGTGEGTSNYVLFDDQLPRILETNGQPTGLQPWGAGEWDNFINPKPKLTDQ